MNDCLIALDQKINKVRDSLEEAIGSLDSRLGTIEEVLRIAKPELMETHDFVWAMYQIRHGCAVKCLANGNLYARRDSGCIACKDLIEFSSKIVDSVWTLASGYERSETFNPLLRTGSFEWAMRQLKDGKCIRRKHWLKGTQWKLNEPVEFILDSDIDADDWDVFYEPHDIQWAAEQLQDDKIVKRRSWKTCRLYPNSNIKIDIDDILADDWELAEDD